MFLIQLEASNAVSPVNVINKKLFTRINSLYPSLDMVVVEVISSPNLLSVTPIGGRGQACRHFIDPRKEND